ncbi:MAG: tRNA 2-thiouridine(34) synthase MnmA [Crocinitomicaceae bacterium]|nr:tRNA 2-thiouridine(34) synthase MnmA [Crocinitomicaceae bacterium]|tara:strand:+ start:15166 stop:16344 length:1179 start_codon:yes stop_codon:yes gene_type:complete
MKRVVVGLSGGVDSSVTALLLKEKGYDVIGMFMRNWHDETVTISDDCPWIDDSNDALLISQKLDIPFQVIDLSKEYKSRIIDYMFNEYEKGRTPNPDILCNREIKFDVFLNEALKIGADFIATGHYCQKTINTDGSYGLLAGKDSNKDQSYFLCQLNQEQLSKAIFPLGEMLKSEVRKIALKANLHNANKKDSQGLCFVGKISLPTFLQQKLKPIKGDIIEIPSDLIEYQKYNSIKKTEENIELLASPFHYTPEMGKVIANHQGIHYYTIGQRKGLHIGGRPKPSFVIGIDVDLNIIYTGQTKEHPGLNKFALKIETETVHFISNKYDINNINGLSCLVRIRYRQPLEKAKIFKKNNGLYILFSKKQRGITPGQFAAFYIENELIGSGVIYH